jgi:hypothetical protein
MIEKRKLVKIEREPLAVKFQNWGYLKKNLKRAKMGSPSPQLNKQTKKNLQSIFQ